MIDPARQAAFISPRPAAPAGQGLHAPDRPVFRMISSDRMGGSVPAWLPPSSAQEATLSTLSRAGRHDEREASENALSYRDGNAGAPRNINEEPFGFGDLVDIINPLQHIPLVGSLYRHITGDQIRPSSAIVGGALFGGALGAAGSLANVIIKEESGRDLTEHALHLASPQDEQSAPASPPEDEPLQRLANAGQAPQLPGSALSFLDMAYRAPAAPAAETIPASPRHDHARVAAMYRFND